MRRRHIDIPMKDNHCLRIAEIVQMVVDEEPALNKLWKTVVGLRPLLRTLPSDLWTETQIWSAPGQVLYPPKARHMHRQRKNTMAIAGLARGIKTTDLQRFDFYAYRIVHLQDYSCPEAQFTTPDDDFCRALALQYQRVGRPAFPNLRVLECGNRLRGTGIEKYYNDPERNGLFFGWSLFVSPSLVKLDVSIEFWSWARPCLSLLPAACRNLREFNLITPIWSQKMASCLTGFIYTLPRISAFRCFYTSNIPIEFFSALASLESLKIFTLEVQTELDSCFDMPSGSIARHIAFTNLNELEVIMEDRDWFGELQRWARFATLTNIRATVPGGALGSFTEFVRDGCAPSTLILRVFKFSDHISTFGRHNPFRDDPEDDSWIRYASDINISELRPLVCCRSLEVLHIEVSQKFNLSDEDIEKLASSWPCLRTFILKGKPRELPSMTLRGLAPLAKDCPRLERVEVQLDATKTAGIVEDTEYDDVENTSLVWFFPGASLCGRTKVVAPFLHSIFPFMEIAWRDGQDEMLERKGVAKWRKVDDTLKKMRQ